jgi:hypothetical protein
MSVKYYTNSKEEKCVDLDVSKPLVVDIKGWSRIFQYSNRDLVVKSENRLSIHDVETGSLVATYDEELSLKNNKKSVIKKKNK